MKDLSELKFPAELVNTSPYDQGWMILVEPSQPKELKGLLSMQAYRDQLKG